VVSTVTTQWGFTIRGSKISRGKICLSSSTRPYRLWGFPGLINGYRGYFPGVKRPGREFDHSPSSSVEVKNDCICICTAAVYLNGVGRGTFTFTVTFWLVIGRCELYYSSIEIRLGNRKKTTSQNKYICYHLQVLIPVFILYHNRELFRVSYN
jgi:hypothetical protein